MDNLEKSNETPLPDKETFYSELNNESITGEDYAHAQKVWNVFEIKNLGEYHDLYVKVIHFCLEMCLKTLEIKVLKFMNSILHNFCQFQD